MSITQAGYLGRTGPVFIDDSTQSGKKILLVGNVANGVVSYQVKQPAFASNLGSSFPYPASDFSLGPYSDNQTIVMSPAYKVPATGDAFDSYKGVESDWVAGTATANTTPSGGSTGGSPTTGGNTGGSTGGNTGGSTGGGVSTGGDGGVYKAPTVMEQISTFLSNYWWLVLLIVAALLWKPVIAPALGMGKKKRYR